MRIPEEDIRGYQMDGEDVCCDCITSAELDCVKADEVVTREDIDDGAQRWFCDRCKEPM